MNFTLHTSIFKTHSSASIHMFVHNFTQPLKIVDGISLFIHTYTLKLRLVYRFTSYANVFVVGKSPIHSAAHSPLYSFFLFSILEAMSRSLSLLRRSLSYAHSDSFTPTMSALMFIRSLFARLYTWTWFNLCKVSPVLKMVHQHYKTAMRSAIE